MEALATYLIKSSVWLTGFALVYMLFLRNERFFTLNRIYLVSGILASFIFPLFTWHYTVLLPVVPSVEVFEPQVQRIAITEESFSIQSMLLIFYFSGAIFLVFRLFRQTLPVFRIIRQSEIHPYPSAKLIRTAEYPASFSFFSFVFVNPSIDEIETNEIVNHEMEHIRQQHWIDLLLFEILRTMQWYNPVIWLYGHFIRQNHEYLADECALQRSSNPAIYRAALLNQMFGGPVISLANSFNYSLNKKRFNMMKQTISSPIRKLKLLLILPLIAGVFYAFAAPEYKFVQADENVTNSTQNEKIVKGKVTDDNGNPLKSASVVISGKTIGTITDNTGVFMLKATDDSPIVISYVGFESVKLNPDFEKEMVVTMKTTTIGIDMGEDVSASKPSEISDNVLVIIDGKESTKAEMEKINPDKIASIDVLKNKASVEKYGEKGKEGVISIKTKNASRIIEFSAKEMEMKEGEGLIIKEPQKIKFSGANSDQPLYIVDGKEINYQELSSISPEKIESVSVLKNESATVMYGEKGKNGVILIELKKANTGNNEVEVVGYGTKSDNQLKSGIRLRTTDGKEPLIVKDGVVSPELKMDDINPNDIESMNVLKGESAMSKYGEKGKNGVLEINMKKQGEVFSMVEEMPQFPGGVEALKTFVYSTLKYPPIALENGIQGQVTVKFVIDKTGRVTNAKIRWGVDPALDKEALRIVESMPKWNPGTQNGEAVDVAYEMPINFNMPADYRPKSREKLRATADSYTKANKTLKLSIVPNPTSDNARVTLDGSGSTNKLEISVYDSSGKLIKNASKNGSTFSLSINKLSPGVYLVVGIDSENQLKVTSQLVVNQ